MAPRTAWAGGDTKSKTGWSAVIKKSVPWLPVGKKPATWTPDPAKTPTLLSLVGRLATSWTPLAQPQAGYDYDSSATYDSAYGYDFFDPVANQLNQKQPADWSPSNV